MRGLKTAVKIWKKEIEFKAATWGISTEHRVNYRKMRQESIKHARIAMLHDLFNRHRIGDIRILPADLERLQILSLTPIYRHIEEIYRKYL